MKHFFIQHSHLATASLPLTSSSSPRHPPRPPAITFVFAFIHISQLTSPRVSILSNFCRVMQSNQCELDAINITTDKY